MKKLIIIMALLMMVGCASTIKTVDPTFDPVKAEKIEGWFDEIFDWLILLWPPYGIR